MSIVSLAEDLRLYTNKIYSNEDNENHPPIQLMATDGSYIVTPQDCSDILIYESNIRDTGKGAGRIVFLPPWYNRGSPPQRHQDYLC
jgi:glycerol-3-phosphate dehydrogenase